MGGIVKRVTLSICFVTAALAAAALYNANMASTTALCGDEPVEGFCKANGYLDAQGEPIFETAAGKITCSSFLSGESTESPTPKGKTIKGVLTLEFPICITAGGKFCNEAEILNKPVAFNWTSGANGTVEFTSATKLKLVCSTTINCTYTFETALDINGGKAGTGTVVASKEVLGSASGTICPGSGAPISLSGTYTMSSPFFVGATTPSVTLCKKNETPCSVENTFGAPTLLSASLESTSAAKFKLKITEESETTEYTVSCGSSTLEGKTTAVAWPTSGEVTSISFGECGGTCAANAIKPPFSVSLEASGSGNGKVTWSPRLRVRCIGAYKCTYESTNLTTTVTGGTPAKMPVSLSLGKLVVGESDAKCGAELKWDGAYQFTKPETSGEAKMWVVREGI
jgi:hypothetical protein